MIRFALPFLVAGFAAADSQIAKDVGQWLRDAVDKDAQVRLKAVEALGDFPGEAQRVVPALVTALKDESWPLRDAAAGS